MITLSYQGFIISIVVPQTTLFNIKPYIGYVVEVVAGHSSVGRAIDCRSIGHLFNSGCPDLT